MILIILDIMLWTGSLAEDERLHFSYDSMDGGWGQDTTEEYDNGIGVRSGALYPLS